MNWLPKREKLDPKQASAIDFAVAQEGLLCVGQGRDGEVGRTGVNSNDIRWRK